MINVAVPTLIQTRWICKLFSCIQTSCHGITTIEIARNWKQSTLGLHYIGTDFSSNDIPKIRSETYFNTIKSGVTQIQCIYIEDVEISFTNFKISKRSDRNYIIMTTNLNLIWLKTILNLNGIVVIFLLISGDLIRQ